MRVLVCGSRHWVDGSLIRRVLAELQGPNLEVIHGDCRGADRIAAGVCQGLGIPVTAYPAEWDKYGYSAGPRRNAVMLDTKPDLVIAFHDDLPHSKGTGDMVRRAKAAGVEVRVYTTRATA